MLYTAGVSSERPDPAHFDDYREYLREMVAHLKETRRGFSYRSFARRAGFASPSFLKLVIDGKSRISNESIPKFARALGLKGRELESFEALVHFTQAASDAERERYLRRLHRSAPRGDEAIQLTDEQFEVYSTWYGLAVRELLTLADFREEPGWVARRLFPRITRKMAAHALELLERTGLAVRDKSGRLVPAQETISTPQRVHSLAVRSFHRKMLELAGRALEKVPVERRSVTSITVALNEREYRQFCRRIAEFEEELLALAGTDASSAEREVYQLAVALFPLSRSEGSAKK